MIGWLCIGSTRRPNEALRRLHLGRGTPRRALSARRPSRPKSPRHFSMTTRRDWPCRSITGATALSPSITMPTSRVSLGSRLALTRLSSADTTSRWVMSLAASNIAMRTVPPPRHRDSPRPCRAWSSDLARQPSLLRSAFLARRPARDSRSRPSRRPHRHLRPMSSLAAATIRSGSKPNFCWSSLRGAEAPKVFMPIT